LKKTKKDQSGITPVKGKSVLVAGGVPVMAASRNISPPIPRGVSSFMAACGPSLTRQVGLGSKYDNDACSSSSSSEDEDACKKFLSFK
jgi:hypothetical protein